MFQFASNNCASLHPGEPPQWLTIGSDARECIVCTMAIIGNQHAIYSVRRSAISRMHSAFKHPNSFQSLCRLPMDTVVSQLIRLVTLCEHEDPEFLMDLVDSITNVGFYLDSRLSPNAPNPCQENETPFKFIGKLLLFSVLRVSTSRGCFVLLGRCLSQVHRRTDIDLGAFNYTVSYALMGKGKNLLESTVAVLGLSTTRTSDIDRNSEAIHRMAAFGISRVVVSLKLVQDPRVLWAFVSKIAEILGTNEAIENSGQTQQLLMVVDALINSGMEKEQLFVTLNANSSLVAIIRSALLSLDTTLALSACSVVSKLCSGEQTNIAMCFTQAHIHEQLVDSLRRSHKEHGRCGTCCSIASEVSRALLCIARVQGVSASLDWDYAFRVVLHTAKVCTIRKVESDAFQVLVVLLKYVSIPTLSEEKLGKKVLDFIRSRVSNDSINSEASTTKHEYWQFLIDYVRRARFNVECTKVLTNLLLERASDEHNQGLFFDPCLFELLRHSETLVRLDTDSEQQGVKLRQDILALVEMRSKAIAFFSTDELDRARAELFVDVLQLIQTSLSSNFLFADESGMKKNIVEWCWQHVPPGLTMIVGNYIPKSEARHAIIRQYLFSLMDGLITKAGISSVPTDLNQLSNSLRSTNEPFDSNVALRLVEKSLDVSCPLHENFSNVVYAALRDRALSCDGHADGVHFGMCLSLLVKFCARSLRTMEQLMLQVPSSKWLSALSTKSFLLRIELSTLFYLVTKVECLDVRLAALEVLTNSVSPGSENRQIELCKYFSSNRDALKKVLEVVANRKISQGIMRVVGESFFELSNFDSTNAWNLFRGIDVFHELETCLRFLLLKSHPRRSTKNHSMKWEVHQTYGLLRMCSDAIPGIGDGVASDICCLVRVCCDFLCTTKHPLTSDETNLIVSALRFLSRFLESAAVDGMDVEVKIIGAGIHILSLLSKYSETAMDSMNSDAYLTTSSICLFLALSVNSSRRTSNQALRAKVSFKSCRWHNLCSIPYSQHNDTDHNSICSVTNAMTLLALVLQNNWFELSEHEYNSLAAVLIPRAVSGNVMMKNAALNCLSVLSSCASTERVCLALERALCRHIVTRIIRKDPVMYSAELVYLSVLLESNFVVRMLTEMDESILLQLKNGAEALERTLDSKSNWYGVHEDDVQRVLRSLENASTIWGPEGITATPNTARNTFLCSDDATVPGKSKSRSSQDSNSILRGKLNIVHGLSNSVAVHW